MTKTWLRQLVLGLVLIGHSPYRAVVELLRDVFDWPISLGTVHNIVSSAVEPARAISRGCDLGGVHIGAHDEIFQAGVPCSWVLTPRDLLLPAESLEVRSDVDKQKTPWIYTGSRTSEPQTG